MFLYFQDPTGKTHCLQGASAEALAPILPADWTPIDALTQLKAAALAQVRALRVVAFSTLAGLQSEALALGDTAKAQAIVPLQQMLRDLPDTDLSQCQTQADIDATFRTAWATIAAAAPASVAQAFTEILK